MLIPHAFLTDTICATDDYNEYKTVFVRVEVPMNQPQPVVSIQGKHKTTPRAHKTPTLTATSPQGKKRNKFASSMLHDDVDDSGNRIEPESHKEHPEVIHDENVNDSEKNDDVGTHEMGSLENRTEKI
ncbi:hypothetical protein Tco_1510198, partial [Tanacetum coccineum]